MTNEMRAHPNFIKAIDDLIQQRLDDKTDNAKEVKSRSRITLAIINHRHFNKIREDILTAPLGKKNE